MRHCQRHDVVVSTFLNAINLSNACTATSALRNDWTVRRVLERYFMLISITYRQYFLHMINDCNAEYECKLGKNCSVENCLDEDTGFCALQLM